MTTTSSRGFAQAGRAMHDSAKALRHVHEVSSCPFRKTGCKMRLRNMSARGSGFVRHSPVSPILSGFAPVSRMAVCEFFVTRPGGPPRQRGSATPILPPGNRPRIFIEEIVTCPHE